MMLHIPLPKACHRPLFGPGIPLAKHAKYAKVRCGVNRRRGSTFRVDGVVSERIGNTSNALGDRQISIKPEHRTTPLAEPLFVTCAATS